MEHTADVLVCIRLPGTSSKASANNNTPDGVAFHALQRERRRRHRLAGRFGDHCVRFVFQVMLTKA